MINKVCRSHLYLSFAMKRISGLLKGVMISLLVCMAQNYQIGLRRKVVFYKQPFLLYKTAFCLFPASISEKNNRLESKRALVENLKLLV
jgi:hypothetical protein